MCDPVSMTVASVAITAASSAAQYEGQRQAASVQADYARRSYAMNDTAVQAQQQQVNEQSSQQQSERARQAMVERGHLYAVQADSGLGGVTDSRLAAGIGFAEGTDIATLEANRQNAIAQGQRSKAAGELSTQGQLASIRQPSLLGAGLQIAGAYVGSQRPVSRMPTGPNQIGYNYNTYDSTPGSGP